MSGKIFIVTGAGISAESGLATFRGDGGIWNTYDINKVCNYNYLCRHFKDPAIRKEIFSFYQELLVLVKEAKPNKAHYICTELQEKYGEDNVKIITTNVDDLHEKAGAKDVIHLHGYIHEMLCAGCSYVWEIEEIEHDERCPECTSKLTKPNVVFFGENAPNYQELNSLLHPKNNSDKDILLVIGSSLQVVGVDKLLRYDRYHKKRTENILVNKVATEFDHYFKHVLHGNATEKLNEAVSLIDKFKTN